MKTTFILGQTNSGTELIWTDGDRWIDVTENGYFDGKIDIYSDNAEQELKKYIATNSFNDFNDYFVEISAMDIYGLKTGTGFDPDSWFESYVNVGELPE